MHKSMPLHTWLTRPGSMARRSYEFGELLDGISKSTLVILLVIRVGEGAFSLHVLVKEIRRMSIFNPILQEAL